MNKGEAFKKPIMLYAIVDIETTGYNNPCNNITEIAIILFDGEKTIDTFQSFVNPQTPINPYVTRLTGISNEMVKNAPSFAEIAQKVWNLTENAVFVAHSVNFDYGMIRNEYKSFGSDFKRKKMCTVRLSRKIFPGYNSYSLGNICASLNIPINDRHRAMGDAEATVKLFKKCIENDTENILEKITKQNSKEAVIPPNLEKKVYDNLPEATGVYYLHNKAGTVIYVGKAINIKQRIYSHFTQGVTHKLSFLNEIYDISYTVTGSELIALLLESDEIKKHYPFYNKAQKKPRSSYGLYEYIDKKDIHRIAIGKQSKGIEPIIGFNSFEEARSYVFKLVEKFELCPKCAGLQTAPKGCFDYQVKKCKGVCANEEPVIAYNKRVRNAIKTIQSAIGDLILTDKGRHINEKAIVVINKGTYKGFGYVENDTCISTIEDASNYITPYKDNYDIKLILSGWIAKRSAKNQS